MKKALVFLLIFTIGSVLFAQQKYKVVDGVLVINDDYNTLPDGLELEIVDGRSITITGYTGDATTLNIPAQIKDLPVTEIGEGAFTGCESLTSVTIPSSVTVIGDRAFAGCESLTSVTIPSSVTAIGEGAFSDCSSLTNIAVDSRNPAYTSINGVLFDKSIRTIITYPVGKTARTYTIPSSVTEIGDSAFGACSNLTSVTIPSSVTYIGEGAFYGCSSLTSVTIPSSVTIIDWGAFSDCSSLTSVTIPSSVTSIGESAFSSCSSLTSITIPSSVTSIGAVAFADCSSLTNITVDSRNPAYASIDGVLFDKRIRTLISYPVGKTARTYTIPSSVTEIGNGAFYGCSSLTSVTIPSSVTAIGAVAFADCSNLTSVTIPSSVTYIGEVAFRDCSSLTSITVDNRNSEYASIEGVLFDKNIRTIISYPVGKTARTYAIPSSVTAIGDSAFGACSNLTSVTIPSSVTEIGGYAFNECSSLTNVTLSRRTQVGENAFPESARITYRD